MNPHNSRADLCALEYNRADMTPEQPQSFEPQPPGMSEISRVTGVFFEPAKTFEDVAARPSFWVPLILVLLFTTVYMSLFAQHVGWERERREFEMSPRAQQMPPEQRERIMQMQLRFAPFYPVGVLLVILVVDLSWAAVLLGIVKVIMSVPVRFKQVFAVVCYAGMPSLIFTVLAIAVMFMKNPDDFNLKNPLAFNPGAFMDPITSSKSLYSLASSLDLFVIWTLVLIAIGLKTAGGNKISFGGALAAVFVPWGTWVLCKSALAGIFG